MTLSELIKMNVRKVRFVDWPEEYKFLNIIDFDQKNNIVSGFLNTGEMIWLDGSTKFWKAYQEGDEFMSRAV
jgi:hypothetical protein